MGAYGGGEPELAIAVAGSAAGMLVIMDRGFPGVALWKAYTQARAHLLIRARSSVARRPVTVLDDGTYLARMNLAGQKGAHPGGVPVRVTGYRVDGGEVIRLLTDLMDPVAFPAGELAALYHQRWESEGSFRQVKTFQRGPQEILRSGAAAARPRPRSRWPAPSWSSSHWHILATGKPYHELGADYFTRRLDPERETRRLIAKLEALGHQVTLQPAA